MSLFSWSQYPHPLYYAKWEKLLGKPNQQPAQAPKTTTACQQITHDNTPTDLTHTTPDEISLYTPHPIHTID